MEFLYAFFVSVTLLSVLYYFVPPLWESFSDPIQAMIAHGFGANYEGSPEIMYGNILWGHFVRLIPSINGLLGYSIATVGMITMFCTVVLYALRKSSFSWFFSIVIVALVVTRFAIAPEFTISAGAMTVAGIICFHKGSSEFYSRGIHFTQAANKHGFYRDGHIPMRRPGV